MNEVIRLIPREKREPPKVWECGACECQQFHIHVEGEVECVSCGHVFTDLRMFDPEQPCGT